jgi:hypothetical protein
MTVGGFPLQAQTHLFEPPTVQFILRLSIGKAKAPLFQAPVSLLKKTSRFFPLRLGTNRGRGRSYRY